MTNIVSNTAQIIEAVKTGKVNELLGVQDEDFCLQSYLIKQGDTETLREVLKLTKPASDLVFACIEHNNTDALRLLAMEHKYDLNSPCEDEWLDGDTPLTRCAKKSMASMSRLLLELGANPNHTNQGETPVCHWIEKGDLDMVKSYITAKADLTLCPSEDCENALSTAIITAGENDTQRSLDMLALVARHCKLTDDTDDDFLMEHVFNKLKVFEVLLKEKAFANLEHVKCLVKVNELYDALEILEAME